jgi:hypothetical protein
VDTVAVAVETVGNDTEIEMSQLNTIPTAAQSPERYAYVSDSERQSIHKILIDTRLLKAKTPHKTLKGGLPRLGVLSENPVSILATRWQLHKPCPASRLYK